MTLNPISIYWKIFKNTWFFKNFNYNKSIINHLEGNKNDRYKEVKRPNPTRHSKSNS